MDSLSIDDPESSMDRRTALQMLISLGGFGAALPGTAAAQVPGATSLWNEIDQVLKKPRKFGTASIFFDSRKFGTGTIRSLGTCPRKSRLPSGLGQSLKNTGVPAAGFSEPFAGSLPICGSRRWHLTSLWRSSTIFTRSIWPLAPTPPTAGFDRCLTLFRKKPEGWKHILYAQCPWDLTPTSKPSGKKLCQPISRLLVTQLIGSTGSTTGRVLPPSPCRDGFFPSAGRGSGKASTPAVCPAVAAAGSSRVAENPRAWALPNRAMPENLDQVLDVFQMERVANKVLTPEVWHFIVSGADDLRTLEANRTAFDDWQIRVRRLVDVSRIDTRINLLGQSLSSPILLAPVGAQQSIHPEGERATMRGASGRNHLMIASTVTSNSLGEIRASGAAPLWFQLYASPDKGLTRYLLMQAEEAGCLAVALTVDSPIRGNREAERWFAQHPAAGALTPKPPTRMGNFAGYRGAPASVIPPSPGPWWTGSGKTLVCRFCSRELLPGKMRRWQ